MVRWLPEAQSKNIKHKTVKLCSREMCVYLSLQLGPQPQRGRVYDMTDFPQDIKSYTTARRLHEVSLEQT